MSKLYRPFYTLFLPVIPFLRVTQLAMCTKKNKKTFYFCTMKILAINLNDLKVVKSKFKQRLIFHFQ